MHRLQFCLTYALQRLGKHRKVTQPSNDDNYGYSLSLSEEVDSSTGGGHLDRFIGQVVVYRLASTTDKNSCLGDPHTALARFW